MVGEGHKVSGHEDVNKQEITTLHTAVTVVAMNTFVLVVGGAGNQVSYRRETTKGLLGGTRCDLFFYWVYFF